MIELDGGQHFKQVYNWGNSEDVRKRDIYKMRMANENGYSVIRLFWEDVYLNNNNWKSKLKEAIKIYDTPQNIYLNEIYSKYY
jgi:very-short-patch-repair endonuclease